jgi:hypothetical protein
LGIPVRNQACAMVRTSEMEASCGFEPCHARTAVTSTFAAWSSNVSFVPSSSRHPLDCHDSSAEWWSVSPVDLTQPARASSLRSLLETAGG